MIGYLTPRRSHGLIELENQLIFLFGPTPLLQLGVQSVQPPLSALLPRAPSDKLTALGPLFGALSFDPCLQFLIFLGGPGAFYESRFEDFGPSVEALDGTSSTNIVADHLPSALSIYCNTFF